MRKTPQNTYNKQPGVSKRSMTSSSEDILRHLAFDNSLQANIIFTVGSGKIIMVNGAACNLLGYSKKELLSKSSAAIFYINKAGVEKMLRQKTAKGHFTALATAIKKSGKPVPCEITSANFMDEDGIEKAITTIADMSQSILVQKKIDNEKKKVVAYNIVLARSRQKRIDIEKGKIVARNIAVVRSKQKEIDTQKEKTVAGNIILALAKSGKEKLEQDIATKEEYKESFRLIFNSSSDVILFDYDLVANKVIISEAYEKEFGYKITSNMTAGEDWVNHIHPEDKKNVLRDYHRMLASEDTEWKYSYRFLRADNSVTDVLSSRVILRDAAGKAYRMIGSMHDVSKQKVLEERLEHEIRLKEKQIAEAAAEAKEAERSDIGKELHDNVNQLLGASKLYLELAKRGGENSKMYLVRSSDYTLTAIEEIRKLTKGLTTDIIKNLGLCVAIDNVSRDTMEVSPVKISCTLNHFKEQSVNDKFKVNVFRIVQEQLNNILKHARATQVSINLLQNKRSIMLTIADNGVGFDTGKKQKGIGVDNIKSRATSYNGRADFASQPGQGCILTVIFPVTDALLNKSFMTVATA